jgi:hypothetical protein
MTEILIPKKNVIFDATILSSLMSCARYMDIRFNYNLVPMRGKSNSLEVGSLIHKVLEVYYQGKIDGFPRSVAIGNALAAGQMYITGCQFCADGQEESPQCKHEPGEYPGLSSTPELNERFTIGWRFALDTCTQYFEHYKNESWIPLAVEEVRTSDDPIYEDEEIRVYWKAKFDLIVDHEQLGIISQDHKTFKQRRDKSSLSNQFSGHCVLLNSRDVIVNKIGLQTTLKIEERLTREIVHYSADRLAEWKTEIVPYYAYKYLQFRESGYWPPNYTHCDNMYGACPYKEVCEGDRGMREEILRNNYQKAPVWDPRNKEDE